jgi:hypothetical protein
MKNTVQFFVSTNMLRPMTLVGPLVAAMALPSYASTLSGSFDGNFSAPTGHTAETLAYEGAGTNSLTWGAPTGAEVEVEAGDSTSLSIGGGSFDYQNAGPGSFLLGTITWDNHSNWHAGGTWNSVMTLILSLDTPDGAQNLSLPFSFSVYNSTDLTVDTDHNETTGQNPDEISGLFLESGALDMPIALGGGYGLKRISFQLDDAGTPGQDSIYKDVLYEGIDWGGRFDPETGLWETREGGTSVIGVYGTVAPVPLPAGLWLLLSGLGGAFLIGRRTKVA